MPMCVCVCVLDSKLFFKKRKTSDMETIDIILVWFSSLFSSVGFSLISRLIVVNSPPKIVLFF
jgi:hypothetical protein